MDRIDFTKDEQYLLQYYRCPSHARFSHHLFSYLYYLIPSAVIAVIAIYLDAAALWFTSYGLILIYTWYQLVQAKRFAGVVPSLLSKYETRIDALEKELAESGRKV